MSFKDIAIGAATFTIIIVVLLVVDAPELFGLDEVYRGLPHWAVVVPFAVLFLVLLGLYLYVTARIAKLREDTEVEDN